MTHLLQQALDWANAHPSATAWIGGFSLGVGIITSERWLFRPGIEYVDRRDGIEKAKADYLSEREAKAAKDEARCRKDAQRLLKRRLPPSAKCHSVPGSMSFYLEVPGHKRVRCWPYLNEALIDGSAKQFFDLRAALIAAEIKEGVEK